MPGIILTAAGTIKRSVKRVDGLEGSARRCALTLPKRFVIQLVSLWLRVWRGVLSSQRGRTRKVIRKGDMTTSKTYARTTGNSKLLFGPAFLALACIAIAFTAGCGGGGSSSKITVQIIPGTTQMIDTGQSLTFMATLGERHLESRRNVAVHRNQLFWRRLRHAHEFNVQQRSIHSAERNFSHTYSLFAGRLIGR